SSSGLGPNRWSATISRQTCMPTCSVRGTRPKNGTRRSEPAARALPEFGRENPCRSVRRVTSTRSEFTHARSPGPAVKPECRLGGRTAFATCGRRSYALTALTWSRRCSGIQRSRRRRYTRRRTSPRRWNWWQRSGELQSLRRLGRPAEEGSVSPRAAAFFCEATGGRWHVRTQVKRQSARRTRRSRLPWPTQRTMVLQSHLRTPSGREDRRRVQHICRSLASAADPCGTQETTHRARPEDTRPPVRGRGNLGQP